MKIERKQIQAITITESGLDPITVTIEDFMRGQGKIGIECYGEAWSCYWGAMGNHKLRDFVLSCDNSYLTEKLEGSTRTTKRKSAYLARIVAIVKEALLIMGKNETGWVP